MNKLIFIFIVSLISFIAFTQPDPNVIDGNAGIQPGIQPGRQPGQAWNGAVIDYARMRDTMLENSLNQAEILLELSDAGIFIYKAGTLAKLDYFNLKLQKKVELFGPMPEKPAAQVPAAGNVGVGAVLQDKTSNKYIEEVSKRLSQPTIISDENSLLIIIGDTFFKVNSLTMNIDLQTNFAKKTDANIVNQPNQIDNLRMLLGGGLTSSYGRNPVNKEPVAKTKNNMLVFFKQEEIIVIDTLTGKVISRGSLPQEFLPKKINNQNPMPQPVIQKPIIQPGNVQPMPGQVFTQPGGKMPIENVNGVRQPGNAVQQPAVINTEKDMTVLVGTVTIKNGLQILRGEAGEEYLLTGPKVTELSDKTKLNKKYRLMGKILRDKTPPFGIGYFDVYSYLELNGV